MKIHRDSNEMKADKNKKLNYSYTMYIKDTY